MKRTQLDIMLKVAELGLLRSNVNELNKIIDYCLDTFDSADNFEIEDDRIMHIGLDEDGFELKTDITYDVLSEIYGTAEELRLFKSIESDNWHFGFLSDVRAMQVCALLDALKDCKDTRKLREDDSEELWADMLEFAACLKRGYLAEMRQGPYLNFGYREIVNMGKRAKNKYPSIYNAAYCHIRSLLANRLGWTVYTKEDAIENCQLATEIAQNIYDDPNNDL